jgi:hypothetical protein
MLLQQKSTTPELRLSKPVASINAFIEFELQRLEAMVSTRGHKTEPLRQLNELFHNTLRKPI